MVRVGRLFLSFTLLPPRVQDPLAPHPDGRVAVLCRPLSPPPFLPQGPTKLLDRSWGSWPLPVPVHSPAWRPSPHPPAACVYTPSPRRCSPAYPPNSEPVDVVTYSAWRPGGQAAAKLWEGGVCVGWGLEGDRVEG